MNCAYKNGTKNDGWAGCKEKRNMTEKIEPKRKYLKFRPSLVESIVKGHKLKTFRFADEKDLRTGDEINLINKQSGEIFADAVITQVQEKMIKDLDDDDLRGQDLITSTKELINTMSRFYQRTLGQDDIIKIIEFKITNLYQKYA